MDAFAKKLSRLLDAQPEGQMGVARRAFPDASRKKHAQLGGYLSKLSTGREKNPRMATFVWIARGLGLTLPEFFTQLDAADTSSLNPAQTSTQDSSAVLLRSEVANAESSSIETLATQFATVIVDYVRRALETGDGPAASAGAEKPKGGRGVRRRHRKSS